MKNLKNISLISFILVTISCSTQNKTVTYDENSATTKSQQQGQRDGERGNRDVFEMDTNNDGLLSKSEVKGPIVNDFDKIDTNGDGFISKIEFEAAPKPERAGQGGGRPPQR